MTHIALIAAGFLLLVYIAVSCSARDFWLSVGSPISPDVRPGGGGGAKILSQF